VFAVGASRSLFSLKSHAAVTEPYKPVKSQEAIQLSKLPDGQPLDAGHVRPIERDDWPAPPAPAAAFPELCTRRRFIRYYYLKKNFLRMHYEMSILRYYYDLNVVDIRFEIKLLDFNYSGLLC